ncbi:MAG: efflux RND transporter periplasmic adaptor subunit [Patescibacteria group bacterium]|jgi:HlyD family secretion protein|nr:efflux RND transporter periplasmic adaptor subunit [Patescibacteria group bacterium]
MNQEIKPINKRRKQNVIALTILVVGTILSFIIFGTKNSEEIVEDEKPVIKEVEVMSLGENQQSIAYLEKTIKLESDNSAEAITEYSGRIVRVNFNVGDYVEKGRILAEFSQDRNDNNLKVSLESVQKTYDLAKKGLKNAKDSAEKSVDLAENGVDLAEIQLDQAKDSEDDNAIDLAEEALKSAKDREDQAEITADAQVNSAKIQLQQTELQLQQAKIGFEKSFIKAPISGFVVSKNISDNDYLNPGQRVAQISKDGNLESVIYLNKTEVSKIAKNLPVNIYSGYEKFSAKVEAVSDIANSENQRFEVLISLDFKNQDLINRNVKAEIPLKVENNGSFFVPLKAVNIGQKRNEVFIVKDEKAMSIEVEMGEIVGDQVEIINGLRDGDELIVSGNRKVRDGEIVRIAS